MCRVDETPGAGLGSAGLYKCAFRYMRFLIPGPGEPLSNSKLNTPESSNQVL